MKNILIYLGCIIAWSFICFNFWLNTIFMGFPKTKEDLMEMGYTQFDFMLQDIMFIATPIIWIAVPILFFIIRYYLKKKVHK